MSELKKRASGVLMHISSLPGSSGIGTLGKYAYTFIDKLSAAGQAYWQILPICPTGFGDSPYQSFSTSAGNPYFIDFEELVNGNVVGLENSDELKFPFSNTATAFRMYMSLWNFRAKITKFNNYLSSKLIFPSPMDKRAWLALAFFMCASPQCLADPKRLW